ncbi:hypothetical protein EAI89_08255 [Eubacterium sp. am_0171]|uniref:Uncharacterized protein n=1 Tax=Hungatella hathewayi TaxID=154046 RepID=A0A3E2WZ54_9FIRM|nr:hypothetical protein DWX41_07850 [Hungatella hathewayi]RYT21424.1 hypothetical protein EAI89_08255 [Eubacterium sp. am_0171]GKH33319.1 hypothetical protein CE91St64_27260 [Faecalicatena contorta]
MCNSLEKDWERRAVRMAYPPLKRRKVCPNLSAGTGRQAEQGGAMRLCEEAAIKGEKNAAG